MKVHVNLKREVDDSYDVLINPGCLSDIPEYLKGRNYAHRYAIITDSTVRRLYGETLLAGLRSAGLNADMFDFPAGEPSKNRETKAYLEDEMMKSGFGRDSMVIALGGGVVGDTAGFVAATYNRKIPVLQVPTTMMSMADSSIGGKVAIDTPYGKNLVGAFHHPKGVFIDPVTLRTLPRERFSDGVAEIVKHGFIYDEKYFEFLEQNSGKIKELEPYVLAEMITHSCRIKGGVVEQDPEEKNLRKILNYGHTIGHALEKLTGYAMYHGYGVSIGMVKEGEISVRRDMLKRGELDRLAALLKEFGLPATMPDVNPIKLVEAMRTDKKVEKGVINLALPESLGKMACVNGRYGIPVEEREIAELFG